MAADRERRKLLVGGMEEAGLDALVCVAASDVLLLTGYWPVMAMSVAILTISGRCTVILPKDETELAERSCSGILVPFLPESLQSFEPLPLTLQGLIADAFESLQITKGRLGIRDEITEQPSSYVVSTNFHDTLRTVIKKVAPHAEIRACDDLLEQQKDAKTRGELEGMDRAAAIVKAGFAGAPEAIQAGLSEQEVAARIQMTFDTAAEARAVERSYGSFYCMSGPNSATAAAAFARTRQRKLETGDLVMIHANTCADGFWTDVTRTYTVGAASERQVAMRAAIVAAREAALAIIKPGTRASAVDHAARAVMESHGFGKAFVHPAGHGVGFAAANAAGHPRIHPLSPDVLQQGSTFNLEPAAYFEGYGGMRHCDVVAVTETGVRVLTGFA